MADTTFSPDWISPPGETIAELQQERGLSLEQLSTVLGVSATVATDLLHGLVDLTSDIAARLEAVFGTPASFWLRREAHFRAKTTRANEKAISGCYRRWLGELPLADMTKFGWIDRKTSPVEQVAECLEYFATPTIGEWTARNDDFLRATALRTSPSFASEPGALAAWLRRGEREAARVKCAPWNPDALGTALPKIRELTRVRDPSEFLPTLSAHCAACGVAVVIARTPSGCRASGATKFVSPEKGLVLLSSRYLSDDHFWFTLFHELGHLLLHGDEIFLEGKERGESKQEDEANQFSARILVPAEHLAEMKSLRAEPLPVARFARKVGVSAGIIVGQLQHLGLVPRNHLNQLKARFKWND